MSRCLVFALSLALVGAIHLPRESHVLQPSNETTLEASLKRHANELAELSQKIVPDLVEAGQIIRQGICYYKGFCATNPASSCGDIVGQEGIGNRTTLPDGEYWLHGETSEDGFRGAKAVFRAECFFGHGGGWTLLFDDSGSSTIRQQFHPQVANLRFKEALVYTPHDLEHNTPKRTYFYNVDATHPDHPTEYGFTPNEVFDAPWVGQDDYGKTTAGNTYPHNAAHYRFKYFGQPSFKRSETLFVLDDGDIGPDSCRQGAESVSGECFFSHKNSKFPQTCYNAKNRGLLSYGCSDDSATFTQCGTCKYSGYGDKVDQIRRSVVQKMFVR